MTAWVAFVFKNIPVMVGTQMSSDCENKCHSLWHSHSNNWILHHPLIPLDTRTKLWLLCYLALIWGVMWVAVQPSVGDSSPRPSCRARTWEGLCAGERKATGVSGEWTAEPSVCTKTGTFTNQECQIVVHLFEGRLYIEVVNSFISVLYWYNQLKRNVILGFCPSI